MFISAILFDVLEQWSTTVLVPVTGFVEDTLSVNQTGGGGLHLLFTLFLLLLHQLHLRSSGIRPGRLGTPVLEGVALFYVCTGYCFFFFFFPF